MSSVLCHLCPDSGHCYWCHLSLVFTLFYKHRNKSQLVSPHIRHIPVFTTLTPPSVFPALPRFPPCLLTPPWPPCPDWPGLVSTCGPLSAPGPCSLIGHPAPGAGPSLVQSDPHCPGLGLVRQSPPWPNIGPLWLHPGKLSSGVQGNFAQWDPFRILKSDISYLEK